MMMSKRLLAVAISAALYAPLSANATNGMNLEGYGPVAASMGGASMAYDNGTAAMANNPATIGMMGEGNRIDVAVGVMGPSVDAKNSLGKAESSADSFMMPAAGWVQKKGALAYGVGMYAQGGMGAEYAAGSAVDQSANGFSFDGTGVAVADTTGSKQRSELGVGRFVVPVAFDVNDKLTVGGSVDYVWGGLDILWNMDATNFFGGLDKNQYDLSGFGVFQANNRAVIKGTLVDNFLAAFGTANGFGAFHWGRFEFSNDNDFTQETQGAGFAGKLGMTYKLSDKLTLGASYQSETAMSDFEGDITMKFNVELLSGGAPAGNATIPVTGKVKVVDFQWPQSLGFGMAYKAADNLMVVADYKRLAWSDVMKNFHMSIEADSTQANPMAAGFAGTNMDFVYKQDWADQDVLNLGVAYGVNQALTLRAGYNYASNPVPDKYVSFLFPATIEHHYTVGFGYKLSDASAIDFSLGYAPEVEVKESNAESLGLGAGEEYPLNTITHSQTNWQLAYSYRF